MYICLKNSKSIQEFNHVLVFLYINTKLLLHKEMPNKVGQVLKKTKVKSTKLVNTKHANRPMKKSSDNIGNSDSHNDEHSDNESWSDASDNDVSYSLNKS